MQWHVVWSDRPKPSEPTFIVASYSGPNQNVRAYRVWRGERPGRKAVVGPVLPRVPGMRSPLSR